MFTTEYSRCTVTPEKYCDMLEREGGLERLRQLVENDAVSPQVREYATEALSVWDDWHLMGAMNEPEIESDR